MTTISVLEKAYGSFSPKSLENLLSSLFKDLRVKIKFKGKTSRGWINVDIAGEDETVATKLLDQEVGLAPVSEQKIQKSSAVKGMILGSDKAGTELRVDIGVSEPEVYDAIIPLWRLRALLADGRDLPLQRLVELFCLQDFMPLHVRVASGLDWEKGVWDAELSEAQLSQFSDWLGLDLDRLIVLGASRGEVEQAVERSRHVRDVVKIEMLGLYEHAITFKLGTDAVGLMPRLGPLLRQAVLAPFSPRRIREEIRREKY